LSNLYLILEETIFFRTPGKLNNIQGNSVLDVAGPIGLAVWGVDLGRLDAETVGSNPAKAWILPRLFFFIID
jgi:hypothetical protein